MDQAGAQLGMSKANTEGAKAQHLKSSTDLKNLDYVEQESGVTQERDLQKNGEQARSQGHLKVLEHALGKEANRDDLIKQYALKSAQ